MKKLLSGKVKQEIFKECAYILQQKYDELSNELFELTDALKNDTKSSMGDKHETSRAMNQLEQEKLGNQINEISKQQSMLEVLNIDHNSNRIIPGSLIITDKGLIFIAVALGKININQNELIIISAQSPLGTLFLGKTIADEILLNGVKYRIIDFL